MFSSGSQMPNRDFLNGMSKFHSAYSLFIIILLLSCGRETTNSVEEKEPGLFETVSPSFSGINFENHLTETDSVNILDYLYFYNGGGVAIGDINNDGLQDIFFTSNQGPNQLYLNEGDFKFENITSKAGVGGNSQWNTGVTMADVNADGYLDVYVVAVSGVQGLKGRNELFINNGDGTFSEMAAVYGIDLENFGTTAAFFDYDNDGDLDLFVLNHAVHTEDSFGPAKIRNQRSSSSGDKLFRFNGEKFEDVSEEAGIFGGPNGYGLGLVTADFNNDGFTDIYVSNDFHEDDYLYINNGDGTFSEKARKQLDQVSRFSMGSDVADINHDGFPDILTLDMLPQDEKVLKSSMGDEDINVLNLRKKFGYHNQFSRNMLQLNRNGHGFQEIALLSGVAATDWSWSALFGDFDQDGEIDLFITNGIIKRPNDLDYIKYLSNNQIRKSSKEPGVIDREAIRMMPEGKVPNYFFKGSKDLQFKDVSGEWVEKKNTFSNGSAYGDLDNDGDLDLVVNNLNGPATLYQNTAVAGEENNYIKIKFDLEGRNRRGIGTKVYTWHSGILQYAQLFTSKGFQSSSEDIIHFGYGNYKKIDSLQIVWPDQKTEKKYNVFVNQTLVLSPSATLTDRFVNPEPEKKLFRKVEGIPGLDYIHRENTYNDFDRQKLIPYRISDSGPAVAVGDLDNDGKDDIFIGNSRGEKAEVFLQTTSGFRSVELPFLEETRTLEITGVIIEDFNGNGFNDLFFVTGGGEFSGTTNVLKDSFWTFNGERWKKERLPDFYSNAGVIRAADYDNDGDLDVFIGGYAVAGDFGRMPESFLLENREGVFYLTSHPELQYAGIITDAAWEDMDGDGFPELLLVGEWMAPKVFNYSGGRLKEETPESLKELAGLWRSIAPFDIDGDGEQEYLLGNWGMNSKFKASPDFPLRMYYGDIDGNGHTETILAQEYEQEYYPLAGLDELVSQMNFLRKDFPDYEGFAGRNMEEVFGAEKLGKMEKKEVNILKSGYLKKEKDAYKFVPFEENLQFAPINKILIASVDGTSKKKAILGGNYFGVIPYHGGFGAFSGGVIVSGNEILGGPEAGLDFTGSAVMDLEIVNSGDNRYLLVFPNDKPVEVYKIN